jgi:arylsulfatase A-like enzyme
VGRLLEKVGDLGLFEDTLIIFTTDHGTYLGEHGSIGKTPILYEEVSHIPLIIRPPDSYRMDIKRTNAMVQPPDLMPTILDFIGVSIPESVQGKSLLPLMRGEEWKRETAISAPSSNLKEGFQLAAITSNKWSLITSIESTKEEPTQNVPVNKLYNLINDSEQEKNVYSIEPETADKMHRMLSKFLSSYGANQETIERWASNH